MTEAALKGQLVGALRLHLRGAVVLRHEDKNTAGIPDISVTYRGRTVWLEVKYANPRVSGRGLQKVTCLRLAEQGVCWFLVYEERKGYRRTYFATPKEIVKFEEVIEIPDERTAPGFDHEFAVQFIRRLCGDHDEQKHLLGDTRHDRGQASANERSRA